MMHIETKHLRNLQAECPMCRYVNFLKTLSLIAFRRKILGVEKNTAASDMFRLVKKIGQISQAKEEVHEQQLKQQQKQVDNSALEAVEAVEAIKAMKAMKEENFKMKQELEGKNRKTKILKPILKFSL